jgi:FkbM family methyltransferase
MFNKILPSLFSLSSQIATAASRVAVYADFARSCRSKGVATVLDVGANRGQFASRLRMAGWPGPIHSFEPLSDLHSRLVAAAARDPNWKIAERVALGDASGRTTINVASNDGKSSSLLAADTSSSLYGTAFQFVQVEEIDVVTLDQWMVTAAPVAPYALKIDVQGFELHVLRGALNTLKQTRVVLLEAPLVTSYSGGASFADLYGFMSDHGFRISNAHASTIEPSTGNALELDIEFVAIEEINPADEVQPPTVRPPRDSY